jgi:hypothetical protein
VDVQVDADEHERPEENRQNGEMTRFTVSKFLKYSWLAAMAMPVTR